MRGRPKRESFFGLFLPSVEWEYKIEEIPLRKLEDELAFGTIARNVRRKDVDLDAPRQKAGLRRALEKAQGKPGSELLLAATNEDRRATEAILSMGPWASVAMTLGDAGWMQVKEYARLEPLCAGANEALAASDLELAALQVDACPALRVYWRHDGLERLADSGSMEASVVPRLAAYLELQIACLARIAVEDEEGLRSQSLLGSFDQLLEDRFSTPGAALMVRIRLYADAKSRARLMDQAISGLEPMVRLGKPGAEQLELPSEKTLNRWFAGEIFPGECRLWPLVMAVVRHKHPSPADASEAAKREAQSILTLFRVARRFDSALEWAGRFGQGALMKALLHAGDQREWVQNSFDHWKSHWRNCAASEAVSQRPSG